MKNKIYRFYPKISITIIPLILNVLLAGCSIEPKNTVPKEYQLGQTSYHRVCAQCHGADGMGGKRAPTFLQVKFDPNNFSNSKFARTILNGSNSGAMPSQKGRVNDEEIGEIIKYIRHTQKEAGIIS
jgi:mono/diheme cytochrome c family protein